MKGRARVVFWLRFLRRLGVGAVLIYATVALTLGGTPAAPPVWYALSVAWLGVVVVCRQSGHEKARWPEIGATNIAGTLLAAEAALHLLAATVSGTLLSADLDGYRLLPGQDYGEGLVGNRHGYPGPELPPARTPGVVRIVALGDSFAVGPAVPFADNYLTRLGAELPGVEVGNFGISGAGPREYRQILETDGFAVQPNLVLVSLFVGNDITESLPRPRYLDPAQHALYRLCVRGWRLLRESWRGDDEPAPVAPGRVGRPPLSPQTFREVEARRLAVCLKAAPPGMDKKWQRALTDLEGIVTACRRRGVPVAVVLIPDQFQVNDSVLTAALAENGWDREQVDLEVPQRRLAAFFAERKVACLDLLPAVRAAPDAYAPRDTHWNVNGNRVAAREIAVWLVRERLVKSGSD